jgi:excisionase family DNA binding protein
MSKLIELKDAANLLGVTPEQLVEMRNRNEISGYRDGTTWKFKESEVERVAAQRQEAAAAEESSIQLDRHPLGEKGSSIDADLDDLVDVHLEEGKESVVNDDLLDLDPTASSTVIGKKGKEKEKASLSNAEFAENIDDLLAGASGLELKGETSSVDLDQPPTSKGKPAKTGGMSDLRLAADSALQSDVDILGGSPLEGSGATGELGKNKDNGPDDILLDSGPDLALSGDELEYSTGSSEELLLEPSASDIKLAASDTGVDLHGTADVTLDSSDSGINLGSPGDSGISLEQTPPEIVIGGESLELGEADLLGDDLADLDDATDLQSAQDFLLEPVRGDMSDESDSGSQVIALDSEEFDASDATTADARPDFVEDEGGQPAAPLAAVPSLGAVVDHQYPILVVVMLGLTFIPLGLTGLMLFDAVRHIWSWDEPFTLTSSLIEGITGMFGS